jgi:hypothetical protein
MDTPLFSRPQPGEYAEYHARYVALVPEGDILALLANQAAETLALIRGLTPEWALHRYAPGKWTVREVMGHVIDTERVFAYRGLCFARGDDTPLPGFEQDDYVLQGGFNERDNESLASEFESLRRANICLFQTWSEAVQLRRGSASGYVVSARAIPFLLAGHERHHLNVLRAQYGLS